MKFFFAIILSFFISPQFAFGAIGASTAYEIRVTGSSNNAGGYDSGVASPGTDFSKQDSAQYTFTDLASTSGTTNPCVVTSASHNFTSTDNGNFMHITAGTNWTAGIYEIKSTSANAATLDRACGSSASISAATFFVGGAYKLGNAFDSTFFSTAVAGNTWWLQFNATAHSSTVNNNPTVGTATAMGFMRGYNSTRGDLPTAANRPVLNINSALLTLGFTEISNLIIKGSASNELVLSTGARAVNVKVTNSASIAGPGRNAINCTGNCQMNNIEAISYNGNAVNVANSINADINGAYLHDSNVCVNLASGTQDQLRLSNSILAQCQAQGVNIVSAVSMPSWIVGNTFYGQETPIASSVGIKTITGSSAIAILNNIFYGFSTGMANPDSASGNYNDYNDFFNNTADITTWAKGSNSFALNPGFANVTNRTGTTATSSGQVLTDSGANFSSIVDSVDVVYITSNTGGNAGAFLITAHTSTTLTVDNAIGSLGTGTAINYVITQGHNFAVKPTMKFKAFPGSFPGGLTTGYLDLGAAQRHEFGRPGGK